MYTIQLRTVCHTAIRFIIVTQNTIGGVTVIEKMKFLSITGPKSDISRVVELYLNKYEIHLENALTELDTVHNLSPFIETNPYKETLSKCDGLLNKLDENAVCSNRQMSEKEAGELLNESIALIEDTRQINNLIKTDKIHLLDLANQIEPFKPLDFDIPKILTFKFIKFRFGRISTEYFEKFSKYVYDNLNTVFYECNNDENYVWGVYFVPASIANKVDAIYSSLHFERLIIPDEYEGTPDEAHTTIRSKLDKLVTSQRENSQKLRDILNQKSGDLLQAYEIYSNLSKNFDVRKLAACTKEKQQVFYILCGWIAQKDTVALIHDVQNDPDVYCFIDNIPVGGTAKPPTKLKNPKIFKPFEMFIKMYGMPAYNEIDPTIFVALTYSFLFGMMFGDAGQGLCLLIGGFILYKVKKLNLAAILSCAGVFSTIFGFMYGSFFGFEDILHPLWTNPMHDSMTVLITAVGFGICLNLVAMILNIINGIKAKDIEKIFFDTNGVAGLVFYLVVVTVVLLAVTGYTLPSAILLILGIGLPLILMFFKEPLTRLVEKKKDLIPGAKGMFFLESFFEMFEVLLSYITNTISFVRVGAFALSHAGMMMVVLMLGKAAEGDPNFIVIILGNLFVAGLEGLVVGIQVLRLEYYEMFSRFYKGTGKEFKPYKEKL